MKTNLLLCLALALSSNLSIASVSNSDAARAAKALSTIKDGRPISPNERHLLNNANLIVVGTVAKVKELMETKVLKVNGVAQVVRGVDTTFIISKVVKGTLETNEIVLHHYRLDREVPPNSPGLVSFTPDAFPIFAEQLLPSGLVSFTPNESNEFELYLVRDGPNRFAPASGQGDPSDSVMALAPPWDFSYIHQANPSVRETYRVHLPTRLSIKRIKGTLRIMTDRDSLEVTNMAIGTNMNVGMWCDLYVWAADKKRPANHCHDLGPNDGPFFTGGELTRQLFFNLGPYLWRPEGKGVAVPFNSVVIPPWVWAHRGGVVPGQKYNVEMALTIFETDAARIYRTWNLAKARCYQILWQRTLNQTFE